MLLWITKAHYFTHILTFFFFFLQKLYNVYKTTCVGYISFDFQVFNSIKKGLLMGIGLLNE